jgi:tetratricopeptide (TPR) repeat protein
VEPENVDVLLALGEAFQVSGDLEQADRLFTAAYQLAPLNWRVFQAFSGLEIPRGNAEAGLKAADMAFELKAEAPILHFLRGTHLARLRRLDEARKEFKLATDANPIDCLSWLCLAEIESEDPAENAAAAEHARKALELDSTGRVADRARRVLQKVGKV